MTARLAAPSSVSTERSFAPWLEALTARLGAVYGPDHEVIVYQAARFPVCPPVIRRMPLQDLPVAPVSGVSTLVVLPTKPAIADPVMVELLGLANSYVLQKAERSRPAAMVVTAPKEAG